MRFLMAVLVVAAASMPVHGATIAETLALCSAKGVSSERLACYDDLARAVAAGVVEPSLPNTGIGKWVVNQELDPIDDTMIMVAMLFSEDWVSSDSGAITPAKGAVLAMRCKYGELEVQFFPSKRRSRHSTGNLSEVVWRLDRQAAVSGQWLFIEEADLESFWPWLSFPNSVEERAKEQARWVRDIFDHSKLVVRIKDLEWFAGDFVFDVRGAEQAVEPVLDAAAGRRGG